MTTPITALSAHRLRSVDALRGLVMIIMALDHTRDFFHYAATQFQPDDLTRTTPALFLTRWITHFCAPAFMFTAGLSAYLCMSRNRTRSELSRFLWTRGLWLLVLEVTVIRFALSLGSGPLLFTILWALGWSMIILGFLVHLPIRIVAVLSAAAIVLHNLSDAVQGGWVWTFLHRPGAIRAGGVTVIIGYPLIPWFAVMAAGFCFGRVMALDPVRRRRWIFRIGLGTTLAFVLIRTANIYGDPVPWSGHAPVMAVLSFLKCMKYPPSLDYLLMTLGPALIVLAWFEGLRFGGRNPLIVFGRVPLFYFVLHLYVIRCLAVLSGGGLGLPAVYAVWIAVVALLYPVCFWFAGVKNRRRDWWLGYL